jgi:hypothetical protein
VESRDEDAGWRRLPAGAVFLLVASVQLALAVTMSWWWLIPAIISVVTAARERKRSRR